jgi:hypothetical protein
VVETAAKSTGCGMRVLLVVWAGGAAIGINGNGQPAKRLLRICSDAIIA